MTRTTPTDYEGAELSSYERDCIDVAITQKAKRSLLVDEDGNTYSDTNKLPVEATLNVGDIEIGAVELKDADTELRVNVKEVGDYNSVIVRDSIEFQKQKINNFGQASVAPSAVVTLASYTIPSNKRFIYTGGIVGGNDIGEFTFEINNVVMALVRNSGSNPTIQVNFIEPPEASSGSIVDLKVRNNSNKTRSFEATLSGFIINM